MPLLIPPLLPLALLLFLALNACSGQAGFERYGRVDRAVEAGQVAMQEDEFERAADAFAQARGLAVDPVQAAQFALDQARALIGCQAEGEALALLIDLADQHGAALQPGPLGDLAHACTQRGKLCSPRLAELCLQIAHEVFDADQLAQIDAESIAFAISDLGTIDVSGLEKLGYVVREREETGSGRGDGEEPVSKPDSPPTMQE